MGQEARVISKGVSFLSTDEGLCCNVYLLEGEGGKKLLIDSGNGNLKFGFIPDVCLLTHGHFDHTLGVKEDWKEVYLHPSEFSFRGPYIKIPKNARRIAFAEFSFPPFKLEVIHTPGHTEGSACFLDRKSGILFSGDTRFANGGYGRTDLGGSGEQIRKSLELIDKIPYKILCPGHGELEKREG